MFHKKHLYVTLYKRDYEKGGIDMCGRYYIDDGEEILEMREIIDEVTERFKDTPKLSAMKTGEIFPTETVPVILESNNKKCADLMKWGYPRFKGSGVIINARAETVFDKNMFKYSIKSRRCLIPTTGFFEWEHKKAKSKKDKYLIRLDNDPMLYLAGIYNTYLDDKRNPYNSFVILTTAANDSMKHIHSRMPVILTGAKKDIWLHDDNLASALLSSEFTQDLKLEKIT